MIGYIFKLGRTFNVNKPAVYLGFGYLPEPALAIPAVGRRPDIPKRVVDPKHPVVPLAMRRAGFGRVVVFVLQRRKCRLGIFNAFPLSGIVGLIDVCVINSLQAARASQLHFLNFAGQRVFLFLSAPPPPGRKPWLQIGLKLLESGALGQRLFQLAANILQNIKAGRFGNRKSNGVFLFPDVAPVKTESIAFAFEPAHCRFRGYRLKFRSRSDFVSHAF